MIPIVSAGEASLEHRRELAVEGFGRDGDPAELNIV